MLTACQTPKIDVVMELNFTISTTPVCDTAQNGLPSNIRTTLAALDANWQQGICGTAGCDTVSISVQCPAGQSQDVKVTVNLLMLEWVSWPQTTGGRLCAREWVSALCVWGVGVSFMCLRSVCHLCVLENGHQLCVLGSGCQLCVFREWVSALCAREWVSALCVWGGGVIFVCWRELGSSLLMDVMFVC